MLDACAAPGGKTVQIAEKLDPHKGGSVTALDLHPKKGRTNPTQRPADESGRCGICQGNGCTFC